MCWTGKNLSGTYFLIGISSVVSSCCRSHNFGLGSTKSYCHHSLISSEPLMEVI